MRTNVEQSPVTSIGTGAVHHAKIKESPKAFHILSSALYSDQVLAVVRELSCNAYDAHVAAGHKDVPFEVRLPTPLNSVFYVKDFGTGLKEDQVYNLYMTYFESTKQDSDDFIGQLGLGCKSPFSYASNFTVESRQGGVKKIYTLYKDENLHPAVTKLSEAPTDEGDGLTVSMAVRAADISRFHVAASRALMYFDTVPNVVGPESFQILDKHYSLSGNNWAMRTSGGPYSGPRVVQGHVSYPVDCSVIFQNIPTDHPFMEKGGALTNLPLDMFVPIGAVAVAPSREALTYDKTTCLNLANALLTFLAEYQDNIQKQLDECDTAWNACIAWQQIIRGLTSNNSGALVNALNVSLKDKAFTFNGATFTNSVELRDAAGVSQVPNDIVLTRHYGSNGRRGLTKLNTSTAFPGASWLMPTADTVIMIDDVTKSRRFLPKRMTAYLTAHPGTKILVITNVEEDGDISSANIKHMLEVMGNPPATIISKLSSLPQVKVATYSYKKREVGQMLVWNSAVSAKTRSGGLSPTSWVTKEVDLEEGGIYVEVDRVNPIASGFYTGNLDGVLSVARALGHISEDEQLIGVPSRMVKSLQAKGDWVELFSHLKAISQVQLAQLKHKHNLNVLQYFARSHYAMQHLSGHNVWGLLKDATIPTEVKDFLQEMNEARYDATSTATSLGEYFTAQIIKSSDINRLTVDDLTEQWNKLSAKHMPWLRFVSIDDVLKSPTSTPEAKVQFLAGVMTM